MKFRKKEWTGTCQDTIMTNGDQYYTELETSTPGHLDPGATAYRLLYHCDFLPALDVNGNASTYPIQAWLSTGVLLCEWEPDNLTPAALSPMDFEEQLDGKWLWRWTWPVPTVFNDGAGSKEWHNGLGNYCYASQAFPSRQWDHDVKLHAGHGASIHRRQALLLVSTWNFCPLSEIPDERYNLRLLESFAWLHTVL